MSELRDEVYEILKTPQLCGLATVTEDGKPWVRYVMGVASEDFTIRVATFVGARKVKQIENNPEVHLTCGVTVPEEATAYLQIQGRARLDTTEATRHSFWHEPLATYFKGPDDPNYGVIEVTPYRIEYCSMRSPEPEVLELG